MFKKPAWSVLAVGILMTAVAACGGDDSASEPTGAAPTGAAPSATTATKTESFAATDLVATKKSPASLAANDAAWSGARVTTVKTTVIAGSKATGPKDVNVQALYSDTDVWFRFEWADTSESTRSWVYDGTAWTKSPDNEDRLALYWEITPDADFETRGCAALCHNPEADPIDKWYMIAPKAGESMDTWHWKSARTNPVGQSDDKVLVGTLSDPTDIESASKADAKTSGGYSDNLNAEKTGPAKMQDPAKKASAGSSALLVVEAVTLDASKLKAGDKVPLELLAPYVGSRGDIETKGAWANGKWVVVMHRKLDTGHDDDVKFALGKTYPFGLSVFDNLDGHNHTVSKGVYTLKFAAN